MILDFFKKHLTHIVLIIIAILLLVLSVQSIQPASLNNEEEVEVYTRLIDKFATWIVLIGLVGVVSYMAVTGEYTQLDDTVSDRLKNIQKSDQFAKMEADYELLSPQRKRMVDAAKVIIDMAASMTNLTSVDTLKDVVEDLTDGVDNKL